MISGLAGACACVGSCIARHGALFSLQSSVFAAGDVRLDRLLQSCAWQNQYMASSWNSASLVLADSANKLRYSRSHLAGAFSLGPFGRRPASTCRNELSDILVACAAAIAAPKICAAMALVFAPSAESLLRVLGLVAGRTRALAAVAVIGEAAVAGAPIRIRRLVAGRARTLTPVAIVRHAHVETRSWPQRPASRSVQQSRPQ